MNDQTINAMEALGFTKTEALCYAVLLERGRLSGYQTAKAIGLSRSTVYAALDSLCRKGAVLLVPGDSNLYEAQAHDIVLGRLRNDMLGHMDQLSKTFEQMQNHQEQDRFYNVEGYEATMQHVRLLIENAKDQVLLNTNLSPLLFENEFRKAHDNGAKITIFSFCHLEVGNMPIEVKSHDHPHDGKRKDTRIMLCIDGHSTLIASSMDGIRFQGTYSDNQLLADIVSEHIQHDILLLDLSEKGII